MKTNVNSSVISGLIILFLSIILFYSCGSNDKTQVIKGHMNGLSDKQTVTFKAKEGQQVEAELIPDTPGNIRFNQIISPSGEADGPFGQDVTYDLNETGEWKFIIGGSLMEGEDYIGDFAVNLKVTNKELQ